MKSASLSERTRLIFAAVAILWGIPYLLIKIVVNEGVPPVFLAWVRIVLAAVALLAVSNRDCILHAIRERLPWIVAFAIAELAAPFPLIAIGEQHIASSLAAVLIATAPLFAAVLALRLDSSERVTVGQFIGLLLGLAGVAGAIGGTGLHIRARAEEFRGLQLFLVRPCATQSAR